MYKERERCIFIYAFLFEPCSVAILAHPILFVISRDTHHSGFLIQCWGLLSHAEPKVMQYDGYTIPRPGGMRGAVESAAPLGARARNVVLKA